MSTAKKEQALAEMCEGIIGLIDCSDMSPVEKRAATADLVKEVRDNLHYDLTISEVPIMKRAEPEKEPEPMQTDFSKFFAIPGSVVAVVAKMAADIAAESGRSAAQEFAKIYEGDPAMRELIKADEARKADPFDIVAKRRRADEEYTALAKAVQAQAGCSLGEAFNRAAATSYGQELRRQMMPA